MKLPYTLDLNPWVKERPDFTTQKENYDFRWLNDQQAHEGQHYFFLGYSQPLQKNYVFQIFSLQNKIFNKDPSIKELVLQTLEKNDSQTNSNTFDTLYSKGARPQNFEKDAIVLPGHAIIDFNNCEISLNPFESLLNENQDNDFPLKSTFTKSGDLSEAFFFSSAKDITKRLSFHADGQCQSIEDYTEESLFNLAEFDTENNLVSITLNKIPTIEKNWGQNLQKLIEKETVSRREQAEQFWLACKVKYDF